MYTLYSYGMGNLNIVGRDIVGLYQRCSQTSVQCTSRLTVYRLHVFVTGSVLNLLPRFTQPSKAFGGIG